MMNLHFFWLFFFLSWTRKDFVGRTDDCLRSGKFVGSDPRTLPVVFRLVRIRFLVSLTRFLLWFQYFSSFSTLCSCLSLFFDLFQFLNRLRTSSKSSDCLFTVFVFFPVQFLSVFPFLLFLLRRFCNQCDCRWPFCVYLFAPAFKLDWSLRQTFLGWTHAETLFQLQ